MYHDHGTWELRGQFARIGSLSYHVVHRDWIQVTMLSRKCLYPLNHLANPKATFFKECVWVFCLYMSMHHVVPTEDIRPLGSGVTDGWAAIGVLGIQPGSSERAGSALNQ